MKRPNPEYLKVALFAAVVLWVLHCDRRGRCQINPVAQRCFELCWTGPGLTIGMDCQPFDFDGDIQITLMDWQVWSEDRHCAHQDLERCPR